MWRELHAWAGLEKRLHARTPVHTRTAFGRLLATLAGSVGLFLTGFFLLLRFIPMVSMFELRELACKHEKEAAG